VIEARTPGPEHTEERSMTLIRVDPASVQQYGREAQTAFEQMHRSLVELADEVVGVRYFGPNAVAFKTECGRLAADFANRLHLDMAAMADAVRRSTSNIAAALGGQPIHIRVDARAITPPSPEVVDVVDVDTAALEAAVPVVGRRFTELRDQLTSNFQQLQATDWEGNAKLAAVDAVGGFTTSARQKCDGAEQSLSDFIRRQVQSVVAADR
jgi:hypothetical protein